jgi:hypothetical protein
MKLKEVRETFSSDEEFIQAVEAQLKALAEANPDFCYTDKLVGPGYAPACHYNRGSDYGPECSGCWFGQALQNLGWSDECELYIEADIDALLRLCVDNQFNTPAHWLSMQGKQDRGETWGTIAKEYLR